MSITKVIAGEILDPGEMVYLSQDRAYKVRDARQIPRGVVSKHYEIGDIVDNCIVSPGIIGRLSYPDECLGTAGEDLIAGGVIEIHADGKWYNKKDLKIKGAKTK